MGTNFFGKIASQNPLNQLPSVFRGAPRLLDPSGKILKDSDALDPMAQAANKYNAAQVVATSPTPFAGKQPTLQDANAGYVVQAQKAAQAAARPDITNPQTPPRAWRG